MRHSPYRVTVELVILNSLGYDVCPKPMFRSLS